MADVPSIVKLSEAQSELCRFVNLRTAFEQEYGIKPAFYARAPGRVNLIGEHIDYSGYGVLPMALEQDIMIAAVVIDTDALAITNVNSKYEKLSTIVTDFVINKSKPEWYHYVLCGLRGVFEHCGIDKPVGMQLMLAGVVPRSAGLSSSSAIVCAAALVAMYANEKSLTKTDLANVCTWSERYIGTQGGGMDQSISFLAEEGTAKLINFEPLTATPVKLPDNASFVVTNSCVELNKAATSHFNTRVVESRLAAQLLAKANDLDWRQLTRMKNVQEALGKSLMEVLRAVKQIFHTNPYTVQEICDILSITVEEFTETILSEKTRQVETFKLLDRATHILTEADRVMQFKSVCDRHSDGGALELGELMTASHESCSKLYECSCDELDDLVKICKSAGALGSRLTGAGWAGCVVSLVPTDIAPQFLATVTEKYYVPRNLPHDSNTLFITQPGGGAVIFV